MQECGGEGNREIRGQVFNYQLIIEDLTPYCIIGTYWKLFKGKDKARCIFTLELVQVILSRTVIDWVDKPDILKEIRRGVKKLLKDAGVQDGELEPFTREIIELAKVNFKDRHGIR